MLVQSVNKKSFRKINTSNNTIVNCVQFLCKPTVLLDNSTINEWTNVFFSLNMQKQTEKTDFMCVNSENDTNGLINSKILIIQWFPQRIIRIQKILQSTHVLYAKTLSLKWCTQWALNVN